MLEKIKAVLAWLKNYWQIISICAGVIAVIIFCLWVNAKLNRIDELESQVFQLQTQIQLTELQVQEAGKKEDIKVLETKYNDLDKKIKALKKSIEEDKIPPNISTEEIVKRFKEIFP